MFAWIKQQLMDFFLDLIESFGCCDRHVWIEDPPVNKEEEVHRDSERGKELNELLSNICEAMNFIYEDPHEGNGWWEKVKIVKTKHVSSVELEQIAVRDEEGNLWTYIPKLILEDIEGEVTGFNDPDAVAFRPTVWLHYHTNT